MTNNKCPWWKLHGTFVEDGIREEIQRISEENNQPPKKPTPVKNQHTYGSTQQLLDDWAAFREGRNRDLTRAAGDHLAARLKEALEAGWLPHERKPMTPDEAAQSLYDNIREMNPDEKLLQSINKAEAEMHRRRSENKRD